jgi:hypothetical protein
MHLFAIHTNPLPFPKAVTQGLEHFLMNEGSDQENFAQK